MGAEVEADQLGDEWKGYILRVAGGNDKQGFPMKQGVLTNSEFQIINLSIFWCFQPKFIFWGYILSLSKDQH